MNILTKDDLIHIEKTLYEPKEEELIARQVVNVKSDYPSFAKEIGYDYYNRQGSAKIFASGGRAKDITFVGEEKARETQKVYTIATGVTYDADELAEMQYRNQVAKGAVYNLDTERIATARKYIAKTENSIFFNGNSQHNIKGILNFDGVKKEAVSNVGSGTGDQKLLFSNKTPQQILNDFLNAKKFIEKNGFFKARTLLAPQRSLLELERPFSEHALITIKQWLMQNGAYFEKTIACEELSMDRTGLPADAFVVFDNDPEVVQLALIEEVKTIEPVYDLIGNADMGITEKTAGAIIRHPSAFYIGYGITKI